MLTLPDMDRLRDIERAHFQRFLGTGIGKELESDGAAWVVVSWPRVEGYPARFLLRNETFDECDVTFFDGARYNRVFRERPPAIQKRLTFA